MDRAMSAAVRTDALVGLRTVFQDRHLICVLTLNKLYVEPRERRIRISRMLKIAVPAIQINFVHASLYWRRTLLHTSIMRVEHKIIHWKLRNHRGTRNPRS